MATLEAPSSHLLVDSVDEDNLKLNPMKSQARHLVMNEWMSVDSRDEFKESRGTWRVEVEKSADRGTPFMKSLAMVMNSLPHGLYSKCSYNWDTDNLP